MRRLKGVAMSDNLTPASVPEDLKQYLKIPAADTSKDDLLLLLLESCTLAAERYIGRYIIERTISEEPHDFYKAKSKYLQLQHYPVREVSCVMQNGENMDLSLIKTDSHNGLLKNSAFWRGVVLVSYTAGLAQDYTGLPKNIRLALFQWIAVLLAEQESDGIKSETLGDYSVSYYDSRQIPQSCALLLETYRKFDI